MRTQLDAVVKAKSIKDEEHLLSLLNYVEKEGHSQKITTIREDDLLQKINDHRKIERLKKLGKGGRAANVAKQFIISFPEEFSKSIDELDLPQKKEMSKNFMRDLIKYIKKLEPEIDIQDFANSINIDIHNDTKFRHLHFLQMNTIKLNNGTIKRLDLGKKGYLSVLKSTLFQEMKKLKPEMCNELDLPQLREMKIKAGKKNNRNVTSYKKLLKNLSSSEIDKNIKFIKKLDRDLSRYRNFVNKPDLSDKQKSEGINQFHEKIKDLIALSHSDDIKEIYTEELKTINQNRRG